MQNQGAFLESQWFADQGFAVVVADGRGTPGRGISWEKAIHQDLADPILEDQVDALHGAAEHHPELDLTRVAIRGWSFGGYLSALAVLRRPDVFHAAVSGAPVTDQRGVVTRDSVIVELDVRVRGASDVGDVALELQQLGLGSVAGGEIVAASRDGGRRTLCGRRRRDGPVGLGMLNWFGRSLSGHGCEPTSGSRGYGQFGLRDPEAQG